MAGFPHGPFLDSLPHKQLLREQDAAGATAPAVWVEYFIFGILYSVAARALGAVPELDVLIPHSPAGSCKESDSENGQED